MKKQKFTVYLTAYTSEEFEVEVGENGEIIGEDKYVAQAKERAKKSSYVEWQFDFSESEDLDNE